MGESEQAPVFAASDDDLAAGRDALSRVYTG